MFVTHIPYRGSGPMLQDLMAGQIQMSIDNLPSALPLIQSGKLLALGVTSAQPVPQLPGVPAIASVLPGYEAEAWFVLVAPAGTPQPIIDKLSAEVDRILKKPEVIERFAKLGATPVGGTPKQLGRLHCRRDAQVAAGGEGLGREGGLRHMDRSVGIAR